MKSIFEYIDYRQFLKDFYDHSKSTKKYFSYRYFARRAKLNSPIFLKMVIDGKRNLSQKTIDKFIAGINLKEKASVYFRTLVLFNQSMSAQEKQVHYRVLQSLYKMVPQHLIGNEQFDYFDKWYYSVLREGVCQYKFKDDWSLIASCVHPQITAEQARDAVKWLVDHKFLNKTKSGTYNQTERAITTQSEVMSFVIRNFHRKMIQLAERSLDAFTVKKRLATGITVGINAEAYDIIVAEIEAFRDRIVQFIHSVDQADRVYQINIQLFPLMFGPDQKDAK